MPESPLRAEELRVVRAMIQEYQQDQAVGRWLGAKWRIGVAVMAVVSTVVLLTGSVIEIAKAVG